MSTTLRPCRLSADTVRAAVATVDDPEYPGVSIADLGRVEDVRLDADGTAHVDLVPTFSGCPALSMIADEVEQAASAVDGVASTAVRWLTSPAWSIDRVTDAGRRALAAEFTVAVRIGDGPAPCPRCGAPTDERSPFGPSRCRAVHVCPACAEVVEVMRG